MKWYEGKTFLPERPQGMDPDRMMGNRDGGTIMVGSKATIMMGTHAGTPQVVPAAQHREMAKAGALRLWQRVGTRLPKAMPCLFTGQSVIGVGLQLVDSGIGINVIPMVI